MIVNFIDYLRERLPMVIRLSYVVLALVALIDAVFVSKEHAHTAMERIPAFWSIFGFGACLLIIIFCKVFGHMGIMTREDYYDK